MPDDSDSAAEITLELIELIYDALNDPSRWTTFLKSFARAVRARRAALLIHDAMGEDFHVLFWHGWPAEDIALYRKDFGLIDPLRIATVGWPEGLVGTGEELCARKELESSAAFLEFYAPRELFHSMGAKILAGAAGESVISAHRGGTEGPFGESEKAVLQALLPHLRRAALLHEEIDSARRQVAIHTEHLNRYSHAIFITDADAHVVHASDAARKIAAENDGLRIADGMLRVGVASRQADFQRALRDISTNLRCLDISRPSGRTPYRLILIPSRHSGPFPKSTAPPAAVSTLVVDPANYGEPDEALLRLLFPFTRAEARIAGKLALGHSAEEIASDLDISAETVRTHLKRALAKTATRRQGELISLILRSIPLRKP